MRKKRFQKTYTVVDRFKRKKKVKFRATIEYIPYPSEDARDEAFRSFVEASLRGIENRIKEQKRRAEEG